jgi:hypothetical protein
MPLTPEQYERLIASLQAEIELLRAELERGSSGGLTSDGHSTSIPPVSASPIVISAKVSRGMGRSRSKRHPFIKALYEPPPTSNREPMTVTDWAHNKGIKPGTVSSWVAKNGKKIPRRWALVIESEFGIPATLGVWRNGILTE